MMGFFDNVKKAFGSKKDDVESRKVVNDEVIDEPTFTESIENYNEEIQTNNSEETLVNEEIIDKPTPNDKIRNFKYLDDLIHSGVKEIVLDSDIVLSDGEESEYEYGIKLDVDDLNIDGNGYVIDANGKARIFYCTGKNVIVKNIVLKNGFAGHGGAIVLKKGRVGYGGAIRNDNGVLTVTESTLTGNRAKYGGAICNDKGMLTVIESTLRENTATEAGGAIDNDAGSLTITKSSLNNNTSQNRNGGAIYNDKSSLTITKSSLNHNTAQKNGGAIYNWRGELTIIESILQENIAKEESGGAIHNNDDVNASIIESAQNNNTAQEGYCAAINKYGSLTITGSTLNNNTAQKDGGAIHNDEGSLTINESALCENTAQEGFGGAIHNDEGSLTITESTLTGNTTKERSGGAICHHKGNFKIFNCEFSSNISPNNIILNNDSLQIHNTIFRDNQSKDIVLNDGDGANLGIFNGEFNETNIDRSILCNDGKFCSIEKTAFQSNISGNKLNIINGSELTLNSPKIKDKGKSILNHEYILIRKSPPEFENTICGEGTVEIDEQVIPQGENFDFGYLDKKIHECSTKEIILDHDIIFENYERDFYEGGIELDIDNLIIDGNGKTINGSDKSRIFIITGKNITLKNIIFKNGHSHRNYDNALNNNGGAIKNNYDNNIKIENCEFIGNTSEEFGGAIENEGSLTITESSLHENTAQRYGGAIHNNWGGSVTITESALHENTAQLGGGAIHNDWDGNVTITESVLTGNTSKEGFGGGAIYNSAGVLTIIGSTLHENTAQQDGGAIYNSGGVLSNNGSGMLTIIESALMGNIAKYSGGAISNSWGGNLKITESTLNNNTSQQYGGAIRNDRSSLTITESKLTENTAKWHGGAIYLDKKTKKYESENCTFKDNKPDDVYEEK